MSVRQERKALADSRAMEEQMERENPLGGEAKFDDAVSMGQLMAKHLSRLHGAGYGRKFMEGFTSGIGDDQKVIRATGEQIAQERMMGDSVFTAPSETREDSEARIRPKESFTKDQRQVRAFGSFYDDDVGKVLPTPKDLGGLYNEARLEKKAPKARKAPPPAPLPAMPPAVAAAQPPTAPMSGSGFFNLKGGMSHMVGGFATGRYEGQGATPSMGLSPFRGGGATPSMGLSEKRGGEKYHMGLDLEAHRKAVAALPTREEVMARKKRGGKRSESPKHTLMDHIEHPKKGFGKKKRAPSARNQAVSRLMREKGMSLGEASRYVKEHGF